MKRDRRTWGPGVIAILASGVCSAAVAQPSTAPAADPREARIDRLEAEVQDLAAEVQDLKRGQAAQIETLSNVESKPAGPPSVMASLANGAPSLKSADGRFTANFHGILQFDASEYNQSRLGPTSSDVRRSGPALGASASNVDLTHARELKDGDVFRRARIGVDGKAFGDWDYRLIFDFGGAGVENAGQLYEGWVQYSGLKPAHLRVGAFSPSIGLEDQASTNGMPLLERSAVEDIARGFVAGDTRTAVELWASGDHWLASAAITGRPIGVINTGTASATAQSYGDQLGVVGRLAGTPFHGQNWLVHVGVHGSYLLTPPNLTGPTAAGLAVAPNAPVVAFSNTPELRVDGTKLINTGAIPARHASTTGVEFAAQRTSLLLQSEYEYLTVERTDVPSTPTFTGYYVEGDWVITGEPRVYNKATAAFDAPLIAHPFSLDGGGGVGALELAVRYSDIDLNYHAGRPGAAPSGTSIRGGDEQNITLGLNWYPNSFAKFMLDVSQVQIRRLSPCSGLAAAVSCSSVWQTPVGAQIGQTFTDVALRSQFAF
jgi:phosphate-selective porin OprO/OprP